MKHPLPDLLVQEIDRVGQYRTLREELVYDYDSSLYRGTNRAMLRLSLTLHPQTRGYGGTVLFVQPSADPALADLGPHVAQGLWEGLAHFRLVDFALVVQELEGATSGETAPLLVELGRRAIRHALHEASFESHRIDG